MPLKNENGNDLLNEDGSALLNETEAYSDTAGTIVVPTIQWKCRAFSDQTTPPKIKCSMDPTNDLVKGDGFNSATYPTFVSVDTATGTPSHYVFDGVDDYVVNWPTMPEAYTVCAVIDIGSGPQLWSVNDNTIETALITSGAWSGKLYRLGIFNSELTAYELDILEYWWVHQVPRGEAKGIDHRMILEGRCKLAHYYCGSNPYSDQSGNGYTGTPTDATEDADGLEIISSSGNVTASSVEISGGGFTVFVDISVLTTPLKNENGNYLLNEDGSALRNEADEGTIQGLFEWNGLYFTITVSSGIATLDLAGSTLASVPVGTTYAVTLTDGNEPVFYADGIEVGLGSTTENLPLGSDDFVIGNYSSSNPFQGKIRKLMAFNMALSASEIASLHNRARIS